MRKFKKKPVNAGKPDPFHGETFSYPVKGSKQ
jgi:hypothetical protein